MGKNLVSSLKNIAEGKDKTYSIQCDLNIFEYDTDTDPALLDKYCRTADFVFNLAGINRPQKPTEFMEGNFGFASTLLNTLKKNGNKCPVMISSSTQATLDNPYGQSKKAGEELMFAYARQTKAPVLVYRFPNIFGKWCRPHYNSAVATFCHNIACGQPIEVNNSSTVLNLVYIDDVIDELIRALSGDPTRNGDYCIVPIMHAIKLGDLADLIYSFRESREKQRITDMSDPFTVKLYATYLSYLPEDGFSYPLKMNTDVRGSFTEIIRTDNRGQFSVNISKPGITKGNHWHHTKSEKFVVVSGSGIIRFRKIGVDSRGTKYPVIEYPVCGDDLRVVDIPTGYTHNIQNLSTTEQMVTFMWASEPFNPEKPDTYYEEV